MTNPDEALTPELLLRAYTSGIFPMAGHRNDPDIFWVDPRRRGILPLDGFHVSRSLARRMRRGGYKVTLNADFPAVIDACADRPETWINVEIRRLYTELHQAGRVHSLEIWRDDMLAGGIYGVAIGAAFFGESMFSRSTDGSKLAMAHLVDHLRQCGFTLFDTQFTTPHLTSLGAIEISRARYRTLLADAIDQSASVFSEPLCDDPSAVLQRITQMS